VAFFNGGIMASNTKTTVLDILQQISDLRGESSTNTDANRIRFVSRTERDFARRFFWRIFLLPNQTTVGSGVNDYTLGSATYPFRPKGLMEVFVDTTGDSDVTQESSRYQIVDYAKFKNLYNRNNATRMVYEWYDVANDVWKMHINPAPEATETITYSYFWEPPKRTVTTDAVICPNPKIIVLLAAADLFDSEDELQKAQLYKNEAEQLILELQSLENTPAVNQLYSMGAIESSISDNGIGSY
jgi:hypothetical protein